MTNNIRQNSDSLSQVNGTTTTMQTIVHVTWEWIILPLSVVILGALFILITSWTASRSNIPIWKEGSLATLFHGLQIGSDARVEDLVSTTSMSKYAKGLQVRMHETKSGLGMTTTSFSQKQSGLPLLRPGSRSTRVTGRASPSQTEPLSLGSD